MITKKHLGVVIGLFMSIACSDISNNDTYKANGSENFTITEAIAFFEQDYASYFSTKSEKESKTFLSTGEFTPVWEEAIFSQDGTKCSYSVPIIPEYKYRAIMSEFENGKSVAYIVNVEQRLIVEKDENNKLAQYMLIIIPDANQSSPIDNYLTKQRGNGGFSGLAIYSKYANVVAAEEYENGDLIACVNNIYSASRSSSDISPQLVDSLIGGIKFQYSIYGEQIRSIGEGGDNDWIIDNDENLGINGENPSKAL